MEGKIFVSYRRVDEAHAGRLSDRLKSAFREDNINIFMDVDAIRIGLDWVEELDEAIVTCDVVIAIISPNWLDLKDEAGKRKLYKPDDVLRNEIASALAKRITVIPVRVGGAKMPQEEDLPKDLQDLHRREAMELRHERYDDDIKKLTEDIVTNNTC